MTITVNNVPADPGCYVSGYAGQYLPDRAADICEQFGLTVPTNDDPRHWRREAERAEACERGNITPSGNAWCAEEAADAWEAHHDAADTVLDMLNGATRSDEGAYWDFHEGELFLSLPDPDDAP